MDRPYKDARTHEADLVFPRAEGAYQTFIPSRSVPAIFAFQNTDFSFSFRPQLALRVTKVGLNYEPYTPYRNGSGSLNYDGDDSNEKNYATALVTELTPSNPDTTIPAQTQIRYLTFNLSSLVDLTVPGVYTLSWSFYAHNCSRTTKWETSPYENDWAADPYAPQPFEGLDMDMDQDKGTDYRWWQMRYFGTKKMNFTIADSNSYSKAAMDPMDTKNWYDENTCPWNNVVLRTTGEIRMASRDPSYRYYYPGYYYPDDVVVSGNMNVTEEQQWNEMNMYCTVLAPPEFGISSVEEGKTRKEDEELRYGQCCNSALKDKKMRKKVMAAFLGPLSLEEATGKGSKKNAGSRVGPVVNGLGVMAVMVAMGGFLLV